MTETNATDHLSMLRSERGFAHMPPIAGAYGGQVQAYESSAASSPHLWLKAIAPEDPNYSQGPMREAMLHLTAEDAWKLADQLRWLVEHHYQGDARPEDVRAGEELDRG